MVQEFGIAMHATETNNEEDSLTEPYDVLAHIHSLYGKPSLT